MEIGAHRKNLDELEAQTAQSRTRMLEINQQREQLQSKLREREKAIESGRQMILRLLGEASTLKNQLAQIEEYLAGIERETTRAAREEGTASAEIERLEAVKKQLSETLAQRQLELESVSGERRRTEGELSERRQLAAELRREIDTLKNEVSQIRARKESLEQVLAHRTYTTESVKRLFGALEKGKAADLKPLGVMADYVEVDPQFEKPAEEFLHEELEYVVVDNWQQAERGLDFIRAELDGRATFLVHPEPSRNGHHHLPEPAIGPETGIAARLSDSLRLTNGFRDRAVDLLPRVSQCFLAEDRGAAQRLAISYPHLYFLLPDGVCYHGHTVTGGKKSGAGPLAMKREARELGVKLQAGRIGWMKWCRGWMACTRRSSGWRPNWSVCVYCSSRGRKTGWPWITTCASWAKILPGRIPASRWRAWNWNGYAAMESDRPISAEEIAAAVEEKERLRAEREGALETERQELGY